MNNNLFSAQSTTIALTANATASAAVLLPFSCSALRIVNEGPDTLFVAVAPTALGAVATLPGAAPGTRTCTAVLPSSDVTLGIANGDQYISAICRAAKTAVASVQVGEGM